MSFGVSRPQAGLETKNTGLKAILALILGIFGLWGVGHIYVGRITRGIVLLLVGIILEWVIGALVFFGVLFGGLYGYLYGGPVGQLSGLIGGAVIWAIVIFAIFIWQIYDAHKLAKQYNEHVQRHWSAPW